jgi:preprotein translocase subunit SecA
MAIFDKILGNANDKYLKKVQPIIDKVNSLEKEFEGFSDEKLKEKTKEFKERLGKGETLNDILPEAFALVREASKRTLNQRHYDCQLIGGIVLHEGKIAEMKTGEGKTLSATLPLYLNALEGKGDFISHPSFIFECLGRQGVSFSHGQRLFGKKGCCLDGADLSRHGVVYRMPES